MATKKVEVLFSETVLREDGTKGNETSIMDTLVVGWDTTKNKVRASSPDGDPGWIGYGDSHTEAVLNYLQTRLHVERKATPVRYSSRVY